jgi:hypothetical protein
MNAEIETRAKAAVYTKTPAKLLQAIKARIDQKAEKGKIKTWAYDDDGDFIYLAAQYKDLAWVHPTEVNGAVTLKLIWRKNAEPSQEIKAIFLARFIEMVAGHFTKADFTEAKIIPLG